jgi:prepilin-type N-terminal cleavage/methylation domain-containing protein
MGSNGKDPGRGENLAGKRMTRQHGFTLSEMAAVLGVFGLILCITFAGISGLLPDWRLREAAFSIGSTLQAARVKAIADRKEVSVPFDLIHDRYMITEHEGESELVKTFRITYLPPGVHFVRPDGADPVTLTPPGLSDKAAVFNPKGRLLCTEIPGCVYLGIPQRDIYRKVRVNLVGTVKVETWEDGAWH